MSIIAVNVCLHTLVKKFFAVAGDDVVGSDAAKRQG
jgi:hypothetical protein